MATPYFPTYHTPSGSTAASKNTAPVSLKSKLSHKTISISAGKAKAVSKAKHLGKMAVSSCAWYEAEDRNLPSVSSF